MNIFNQKSTVPRKKPPTFFETLYLQKKSKLLHWIEIEKISLEPFLIIDPLCKKTSTQTTIYDPRNFFSGPLNKNFSMRIIMRRALFFEYKKNFTNNLH